MSTIPLSQALLCVNCELISTAVDQCPKCGSEALVHLARWIQPIQSGKSAEQEKEYASC